MGDVVNIAPARQKKLSLLDRLEAHFRKCQGQWIDGRALENVAGVYAWRSRVSDLRILRGMTTIENRLRKVKGANGQKITISEYRFPIPPPAPRPRVVADATNLELDFDTTLRADILEHNTKGAGNG